MIMLILLVAFTEWMFYEFMKHKHWKVPGSTIDVWLSTTFVQVVGLVAIVVHYLFPRRDRIG